MKRDIASRLSCPACSSDLQLEVWRDDREEVDEGVFRCGCGEWFPVLRGIPRMLVSPHREALLQQETEFSARRGSLLPAWKPLEPEGHERVQRSTAESFGAQWKTFSEMRAHYEQLFHSYFDEIDVKRYRSRPVLDAGCGMGRWAVFWAAAGAEVFAVDLGSAVESAAANLRGYPGAHVIQADLLRLPFPENSFDAVYSMGVLHHLPDPAAGFRAIAAHVAPAGELGIYLYYSLENRSAAHRLLLRAMQQTRRVTVRLPYGALKALGRSLAVVFSASLIWPARLLQKAGLPKLAAAVPLSQYAPLDFRILNTDMVDRFGAPLERRFSRAEISELYADAGFEEPRIPNTFPFWHAWGRKRPSADPTS